MFTNRPTHRQANKQQFHTAQEASWRRVFDPVSILFFDLYRHLEQNGAFWLLPEYSPGPGRGKERFSAKFHRCDITCLKFHMCDITYFLECFSAEGFQKTLRASARSSIICVTLFICAVAGNCALKRSVAARPSARSFMVAGFDTRWVSRMF